MDHVAHVSLSRAHCCHAILRIDLVPAQVRELRRRFDDAVGTRMRSLSTSASISARQSVGPRTTPR